jgi:nucleoside-diphosphate-sugar epimerase
MARVVLVTGADGFVGRHMVSALIRAGWHVRCAQRSVGLTSSSVEILPGLELGPSTNWQAALNGVQAVVHLAARAHRSENTQQREKDLYFSINVEGTMQLARSAITAEVQKFIFLSSIAVNGSTTDGRGAFSEHDCMAPNTVYGKTKAAAEHRLSDLAADGKMSITAIRAPMIYGAGAVGNFERLRSAVRSGVPLPFGLIKNRRAFLGIDNLTSFVQHRLETSNSSQFEVFLLADSEQVSTPEFIRLLARASTRPARLLPVPLPLLRVPMNYFGLNDALLGSLEMDVTKALATGWHPPFTLVEGLSRAVSAS